jgi:hypothetical protein
LCEAAKRLKSAALDAQLAAMDAARDLEARSEAAA